VKRVKLKIVVIYKILTVQKIQQRSVYIINYRNIKYICKELHK